MLCDRSLGRPRKTFGDVFIAIFQKGVGESGRCLKRVVEQFMYEFLHFWARFDFSLFSLILDGFGEGLGCIAPAILKRTSLFDFSVMIHISSYRHLLW